MTFDDWWLNTGRTLDPDTSDVSWHDKRKGLAEIAWNASGKSPSYQTGWVLEGGLAQDGSGLRYIGVVDGMLGWTTDNLKALRLSRREDADALAELVDDCEKVTEHRWG